MQTSTPLLAALALLLSFADGAIAQIEEKKRERPFVRDPRRPEAGLQAADDPGKNPHSANAEIHAYCELNAPAIPDSKSKALYRPCKKRHAKFVRRGGA